MSGTPPAARPAFTVATAASGPAMRTAIDSSKKSIEAHERDVAELRAHVAGEEEKTAARIAELAGVSNPYLSQIERGLRKPSAAAGEATTCA